MRIRSRTGRYEKISKSTKSGRSNSVAMVLLSCASVSGGGEARAPLRALRWPDWPNRCDFRTPAEEHYFPFLGRRLRPRNWAARLEDQLEAGTGD